MDAFLILREHLEGFLAADCSSYCASVFVGQLFPLLELQRAVLFEVLLILGEGGIVLNFIFRLFFFVRGLLFNRLSFQIDLALQVLVESFENLFLGARNLELLCLQSDCVALAAAFFEIKLVVVGAASPPPSVHHLLIVLYSHFVGGETPSAVTKFGLLSFAISAVASNSFIRRESVNFDKGFPIWEGFFSFHILQDFI